MIAERTTKKRPTKEEREREEGMSGYVGDGASMNVEQIIRTKTGKEAADRHSSFDFERVYVSFLTLTTRTLRLLYIEV